MWVLNNTRGFLYDYCAMQRTQKTVQQTDNNLYTHINLCIKDQIAVSKTEEVIEAIVMSNCVVF